MFSLNITSNAEERFVKDFLLPLTLKCTASRKLQDDVALLKTPGELLITTDSVCEGIHYKKDTPPSKIAHKLLARNLSDIACKGGKPLYYNLSIFAAENTTTKFLQDFISGLTQTAKKLKIALIGGDTAYTKSNLFSAAMTLYGKANTYVPARNGSKIGDNIYITGKIGRAYLGYMKKKNFISYYETPNPPVILMQKILKKYKITSSIDISDGFIKDIKTLLFTSKKGAVIDYLSLPLALPIKNNNLLTFGDDYEIIFTSPENIKEKGISHIGYIENSKVLKINNTPLKFHIENEGYSQIK